MRACGACVQRLHVLVTCMSLCCGSALTLELSLTSLLCTDSAEAMSGDELDRLIDMDPSTTQACMEDEFLQSAVACSQAAGAEPFAAPAPQAVRLLAPSVDEATVRAPESRKREQALTLWETPPQTPVVKRRICGKRPDAAGIYAGMKSSPVVEPCFQLEQHEFMRQSGRGQYLAFMYRLRRWVAIVEAKAAPEGISQYILQCRDASFQLLSPSAKAELVRGFLDATAAPDWLREWAVERWHLHRCGKGASASLKKRAPDVPRRLRLGARAKLLASGVRGRYLPRTARGPNCETAVG